LKPTDRAINLFWRFYCFKSCSNPSWRTFIETLNGNKIDEKIVGFSDLNIEAQGTLKRAKNSSKQPFKALTVIVFIE